jgi:hypothetical protein
MPDMKQSILLFAVLLVGCGIKKEAAAPQAASTATPEVQPTATPQEEAIRARHVSAPDVNELGLLSTRAKSSGLTGFTKCSSNPAWKTASRSFDWP